MIQLARWKVTLVVLSLVVGLLLAFPSVLSPAQRDALPGWLPKNGLNLGLDLQGAPTSCSRSMCRRCATSASPI